MLRENITIKKPDGHEIPLPFAPVDKVGTVERANFFTTRSIKKDSKLWALYTAIKMVDLTTLEGADTDDRVRQLCAKAIHPAPPYLFAEMTRQAGVQVEPIPSVAAVCVYPNRVKTAVEALQRTGIQVASVATGFPAGQVALDIKLQDVHQAVEAGATEIDMVIDRGAFHEGRYQDVFDEIVAIKKACGKAHLKVILETGELGSFDNIRLASNIAMEAGGDFIKTSTGKIPSAASMPVTLVMLQAIADYYDKTGKKIGMKPAGGIRTAKQAIHYLCMVSEVLGPEWMTPDLFRFGASSLLNDLLRQVYKQATGRYYYSKAFSLD
ncbi:MAG: deoxyribose-phosphate aldolase [Bdellovibrionaceae bacterium]|nr:deoxyribose-phosphate aldolase [Pseudobdellovibrionaceae bacterium]